MSDQVTDADREAAVEFVDGVHGYTLEFAHDPEAHQRDYEIATRAIAKARAEGRAEERLNQERMTLMAVICTYDEAVAEGDRNPFEQVRPWAENRLRHIAQQQQQEPEPKATEEG